MEKMSSMGPDEIAQESPFALCQAAVPRQGTCSDLSGISES